MVTVVHCAFGMRSIGRAMTSGVINDIHRNITSPQRTVCEGERNRAPLEGYAMFDPQCDLAALVYEHGQDPDRILCDFAADLNANGYLAVGLVQLGGGCLEASLSARLVHTGEELPLLQDLGACDGGCRLDRLLDAGQRTARAIDHGADIVIVNRFGRQECEGKGLSYLIAHALQANFPVVIAVASHRFADWIKFAGGMSVKLACARQAQDV